LIADLSAAVDVYSEWVDAAGKHGMHIKGHGALMLIQLTATLDAVAQGPDDARPAFAESSQASGARRSLASRQIDEEDDRRYTGDGIVADDEGYD
jgi:hypothetical protein